MPNPGSDTVPKGLLPVELPRTVLDAVQAVLRLGLQYLWVDKYCIDQDDAAGLESQIAIMDTVYHLADVTIVVACGKDASFGLPGIGLTRRREQPIINFDGRVLASCLHDPIEIIRRSKWNTRGWTYQEGLFSRRRLFFTDEQVYFECNGMACMESDTSCYTLVMPLECAGNASVCKGGFNPGHAKSLAHRIKEYTRRDLSFQSDALNAMQGIFRAFAALPSPTRHFWGIPMDIWPADKPGYPRGSAGKLCSEESFARSLYWFLKEPSHRREGFPTWSWAGWKGKISDSFHAPGWSLGLQRSDESCDIKVWLGRTDGTYGRFTDSVAEEACHLTTGFAPVFCLCPSGSNAYVGTSLLTSPAYRSPCAAVNRVSKAPTGPKPHTDIPNTPGGPNRSVVVHRNCSCETKKTTLSRRIGPVATRYSSSTFHEPSCPWSWANRSESDYAVSLSMRPFLNKTVNYLFSASHWVEVGFGNVRPLFALTYVYSTKYNEKRRMEPMALGT